MSDLKSVDRMKFEKLFWMNKWYLLNFSNNSFSDFVMWSIWIDPYNKKYDYWDSKANRLRWIILVESNQKVWQLLLDLLEYWKILDDYTESDIYIYSECYDICKRLLETENVSLINPESTKKIDHKFANEQIEKCIKKLENDDFNWAITNARSFIEAIMIEIIEEKTGQIYKNDGKINKIYSKTKSLLNLENRDEYPFSISQILDWFDKIINWLADLSNNISDRHANKFNTQKHHAKLAINWAITISDFLIDSWKYQNNK